MWTDFAKHQLRETEAWPMFNSSATTMLVQDNGVLAATSNWRGDAYEFFSLWEGYCGTVYPCDARKAGKSSRGGDDCDETTCGGQ